jgi:hypothetical protein
MIRWLAIFALGCSNTSSHSIDAPTEGPAAQDCPADPCTSSEFCYSTLVGVAPMPGCNDLPAACTATPTCACLLANVTCTGGLACDDTQGLHVICSFP